MFPVCRTSYLRSVFFFFFKSFWRNLSLLWNLIGQVMQPDSLGKLCLLALALSEHIHSFFFSFIISRWQITTDNFVFLPSDIRWPTRGRLENANWRSPWPLPMMLENTPFSSRIHTEKSQPPLACWRKVFSVLLFLRPGIFITSECPISQTHLLCRQPFECIKKKSFVGPAAHSISASIFTEQYEAYMKLHDVTYKTEVTTTVIQEPSVVVSQYELEQRRVTTSFVSEKVCSL